MFIVAPAVQRRLGGNKHWLCLLGSSSGARGAHAFIHGFCARLSLTTVHRCTHRPTSISGIQKLALSTREVSCFRLSANMRRRPQICRIATSPTRAPRCACNHSRILCAVFVDHCASLHPQCNDEWGETKSGFTYEGNDQRGIPGRFRL